MTFKNINSLKEHKISNNKQIQKYLRYQSKKNLSIF